MRRALVATTVTLAVMVSVGVGWRHFAATPSSPPPALVAPDPEELWFPMPPQRVFAYSLPIVRNGSREQTAVLDSIVLTHLTPGLVVLGTYARRLGLHEGMSSAFPHWPPNPDRYTLEPVAGFRMPPERLSRWDLNAIFKLRATRSGTYSSPSIRIRYHVGGHEYTLIDPLRLVVCATYVKNADCNP